MGISSELSYVSTPGDGSTTAFPFTFAVFDEDHLLVTVRDTDDAEEVQVLDDDYTVSFNTDRTGTVTFVTAPASGYTVVVRRKLDLVQEADFNNQGSFYAKNHEDAFDKAVMIDQQQQYEIEGAIRLSETDARADMTLPVEADRANKYLAFDADGEPIASDGGISASIPVSSYAETLLDDTTAAEARATLGFAGTAGTIEVTDLDGITVSSPRDFWNFSLSTSVGSSALTIAFKDSAGSNASAASPIVIPFRSTTATSGAITRITGTSALSLTVPSTATLGHTNGNPHPIFIYALNNAGTMAIGLSSSLFDDTKLVNTSLMNASSTSQFVMYSASALTGVACRLVGWATSTQTTAGTWGTVPTNLSVGYNGGLTSPWQVFTPTGTSTTNATHTGMWRRVGANREAQHKVTFSGANTQASPSFNIPNSAADTIDTSRLITPSTGLGLSGSGTIRDDATATYPVTVYYFSTTAVAVRLWNTSGTYITNSQFDPSTNVPMTVAANDFVDIFYAVPITPTQANGF